MIVGKVTLELCQRSTIEEPTLNPFSFYWRLNKIWNTDLTLQAREATGEWQVGDIGEVYLIKLEDKVIGITGWWPITSTIMGLRWHGVSKSYRAIGVSKEALKLLIAKLPEEATTLCEVAATEKASEYFLKHGWELSQDPEINAIITESNGGELGKNIILLKSLNKRIYPLTSNWS